MYDFENPKSQIIKKKFLTKTFNYNTISKNIDIIIIFI